MIEAPAGTPKLYLDVRDVPAVLKAFIEATTTPLMNTLKFKRNEAAKELVGWFNSTVLPAKHPRSRKRIGAR